MNEDTEHSVIAALEDRLIPTAVAQLKVVAPSLDELMEEMPASPVPSFFQARFRNIKPDCISFGGTHFHDPPAEMLMMIGCYVATYGELIDMFEDALRGVNAKDVEEQADIMARMMYKWAQRKLGR